MNFLAATAAGYTADQVLEFLTNSLPSIGKRIKQAKRIGHDTKKILETFKDLNPQKLQEMEQRLSKEPVMDINPLVSAQQATEQSSSQTQLPELGKNLAKTALGSAVAYYGLKKGLPFYKKMFADFGISPAETVASEAPGPSQPASIFPENVEVPEAITPEEAKRRTALQTFNEKKKAPKKNLLTGIEQSFEQEYGKPTEVPKPVTSEQVPQTETFGNLALTPQGDLGEIESIKNGIAKVKIGDKYKTRKESDLETLPLPQKDLADLHDELIAGIEKETGQQVSRNVNWAGYDPGLNQLAYIPHGSDSLYVYDNVPEEDVKLLTNVLAKRKSSGDNYIGAWEAGSKSPIGNQMYNLIQKLQKERGGKGKEYSGKFKSVYSSYEPAVKASKKKKKEKEKREAEERKKHSGNIT